MFMSTLVAHLLSLAHFGQYGCLLIVHLRVNDAVISADEYRSVCSLCCHPCLVIIGHCYGTRNEGIRTGLCCQVFENHVACV